MSSEKDPTIDHYALEIELQRGNVPVSYMSSLLRVMQAALRQVALTNNGTREQFDRRPQPVLVISRLSADDTLSLELVFIDPLEGSPMHELSNQTFGAFLDGLATFVSSLPQPGLWGGPAHRSPQHPFESEVARRMHQVYSELRRTPRAVLRFQGRSIEIEGDRMEIV